MARWTGEGPNQEYLEDILSAADAWRERCLLKKDGSVFLDDEELWSRENVQELREACQPPRHGTRDTSWSFLKQQLQDKRPEILRLAAEAVWLTDLYPTTRAGEAPSWKRNRFKELWESSSPPPPESKHLSDRALQGVSNVPGQHWVVQHPLQFLLVMSDRWKAVPRRVEIAKDPWRFVDWLNETMPRNPSRPMRNALLYLLYPDVFEPIGSSEDKRKIVTSLKHRLSEPIADTGGSLPNDRAIHEIRKVLEREHGRFDFFDENIQPLWNSGAQNGNTSPGTTSLQPLNLILYGPPGTGKPITPHAAASRSAMERVSRKRSKFPIVTGNSSRPGKSSSSRSTSRTGTKSSSKACDPKQGPARVSGWSRRTACSSASPNALAGAESLMS